MKIRTPMNAGDIAKATEHRNEMAKAAAIFDTAYQALDLAIANMAHAARGLDFFIDDPEIDKFLRSIHKTRLAHNKVGNYSQGLSATRCVDIADEALREAWD